MKQIAIASPMVITTEYRPLQDVFFDILSNDEPLEQWYYQNSGIYKPDRRVENLILRPEITVVVPEWGRSSGVVITSRHWYYNEGSGMTEVLATSDGVGVQYYRDDDTNSLVIKKNVLPDAAVIIKGVFQFADPRSGAIIYEVEKELTLASSRDSDPIFPTLDVTIPSSRLYNPVTDDEDSIFHFEASAKWGDCDITSEVQFDWSVIDLATDPLAEMPILSHPAFSEAPDSMILPPESGGSDDPQNPTVIQNKAKGQYADSQKAVILMDARFSEHLSVICRARYIYTPVRDPEKVIADEGGTPASHGWHERTVTEVTPTAGANPKSSGWYEEWYGSYIPSQDTSVVSTKTYYAITNSVAVTSDTTVDPAKLYVDPNGALFPDKVAKAVLWEDVKIDAEAYCGGGNAIQDNDIGKTFNVICNIRGGSLTDEQKDKHLLFEWKKRLTNGSGSTPSVETPVAWGKTLFMKKGDLTASLSASVQVRPYVYLKGAYRRVGYSNGKVTYTVNGVTYPVYART